VLQTRSFYQSIGRRFFYSPGVTAPYSDTSEAPGNLLAPGPAVRTGALIGYARVSTSGQLLDRQQHALAEAGCLRVVADKLSGKNADRPELAACLDYLRRGDTLVAPRLDRLSRSLADLVQIVGTQRRHGVGFKRLHEALDTTTPSDRLVFHVFAAWRSSSASRSSRVPAKDWTPPAPAARVSVGPPAMTAEQIRHARDLLIRPDNTVSLIARLLGASRATIYKYVPEVITGRVVTPPAPASAGLLGPAEHGPVTYDRGYSTPRCPAKLAAIRRRHTAACSGRSA
jgi:DNA invertase Pin-like site-specific DNA recombinase